MTKLALLASLVVSGCASNDQIAPSQAEYDDLALSIGSTVAMPNGGGELGALGDVVAIAHGGLPTGFAKGTDGVITGTHTGLDYSYQVACDGAQCAAQVAWNGSLDLPTTGMTFDRSGPWTFTLGDGATANGTATLTYESTIVNTDRGYTNTYALTYDGTYENVSATSGDIHYAISVERHQSATNDEEVTHYDVDADLAVNGDGTATMTLDGGHAYALTLATASVVRL
jgi:hypothetical protein